MKNLQRILSCAALTAALTGLAGVALADGGFLSAPEYYLYERSQSALLQLRDGVEDLCILPEFYGDAADFVWIVPVPALPTITQEDEQLFTQIGEMTRPVYRYRDANWGCEETRYYDELAGNDDGTQIVAEEVIGMYRTLIIASDDGAALADSLSEWGYLHVANSEAVGEALQYYVDREWYFVAMKVDENTIQNPYPYYDYWYGMMQPVRLRFAADRLVYPLRISQLSSLDNSAIHLYVLGDHRVTLDGFETWYANRITADERAAIRRVYPRVGDEVQPGDFLTRLVWDDIRPSEMVADLYPEAAANDTEMRLVNYSGLPLWNLFLAGSALGWLGLKLRRRFERRGREA